MGTFLTFVTKTLGVTLTEGQRVLCATAFDGEPSPDTELARALYGGMVPALDISQRKTVAWVKGRDVGGSMLSAYRVLHLGLTLKFSDLAHGERIYGLIVAPDMRLAGQGLDFIRGACENVPALSRRITEQDANSITLKRTDGRIVVFERLPATRGGTALRGRSIAAAHFSEYAFFRNSDFIVNDLECYRAVLPRVRGQILLESSPWIESGHLFDLFTANYGAPSTALAAHTPTLALRPEKADEVAAEFAADSDTARRERGAEFLSAGTGAFFDGAAIDLCVDEALTLPAYFDASASHHFAVDAAFESDSTACVGVAVDAAGRLSLAHVLELRPEKNAPILIEQACERIATIVKSYGAFSVMGDQHHRAAVSQLLAKHGVVFLRAPDNQDGKAQSYLHLRELLKARRIRLPNDARLIGQLKAIISAPTPGGGLKITSPRRGGHGDLVSALVLACWQARRATTATKHTPNPRVDSRPSRIWGSSGPPPSAFEAMNDGRDTYTTSDHHSLADLLRNN